mmetsp:Transcript_168608/g.409821  ORF Transcript_168608/g.409821 Transcript_168608/m.409821 type:complete len:269 (-) Transcript_168608:30-836(-)
MLLPMPDLTLVGASIWPFVSANTVLLAVDILPQVFAPIGKRKLPAAVHLILSPLPLVLPAIIPDVQALPVERVRAELALVRAAKLVALVGDGAHAALDAGHVLAHKHGAVREGQRALAVLLAVHPLPVVHRAVRERADALAVRHVVDPGAHVDAAVGVLEGAEAVGLAAAELAPVGPAVRPDLVALAVRLVAEPLAGVPHAARKDVLAALFSAPLCFEELVLLLSAMVAVRLPEAHRCRLIHGPESPRPGRARGGPGLRRGASAPAWG